MNNKNIIINKLDLNQAIRVSYTCNKKYFPNVFVAIFPIFYWMYWLKTSLLNLVIMMGKDREELEEVF
jgi:hypothetical protein